MQMTKAAAVAILAFTSSALAYYPGSGYSTGIYAREAYPEAYPEAEFDFEDIYARDAEPEFDIHPRDAYMEGYEAGLYARAVEAQQKSQGGRQPGGAQSQQFNLNNFQKDSQQEVKYKQDIGADRKSYEKERKEMLAAQKQLNGAENKFKQNEHELAQDRKEFGSLRQKANENTRKPGQQSRPGQSRPGQEGTPRPGQQSKPQRANPVARDVYDYYGFDY